MRCAEAPAECARVAALNYALPAYTAVVTGPSWRFHVAYARFQKFAKEKQALVRDIASAVDGLLAFRELPVVLVLCSMKAHQAEYVRSPRYYGALARVVRAFEAARLRLRAVYYRPAPATHFASADGEYRGNATDTHVCQALDADALALRRANADFEAESAAQASFLNIFLAILKDFFAIF